MPRQDRSKQGEKRIDRETVREWLIAAERGDLVTLKHMLAAGPAIVDAIGRGPYWTGNARALHYAAYRGHRRVVRWLLARGASARPVEGDFDWAPLHFAAMPAKRDVVRLLIEHGAPMDAFVAAALGDARTIRRMLRANPGLVAARGPDGATPLHFAGTPSVARLLLAAGSDPTAKDRFHGETPAQWAHDRPDVVAVIAGGDVDFPLACALGDLRRVRAFVRKSPGSVNSIAGKKRWIGHDGETPLGIAARYGQGTVVEFLLEHGAQLARGPSLLPGAVNHGDRVIVRRLLDAGADPNAFGPHGHAALHAAAVYGSLPMLRLLISRGARPDLKDKEHDGTALDWARYHRHDRAAAYLEVAGKRRIS